MSIIRWLASDVCEALQSYLTSEDNRGMMRALSFVRVGVLGAIVLGSWGLYAITTGASAGSSSPLRLCVTSADPSLPSGRAVALISSISGRLEASHVAYSARLRPDRVVPFKRPVVVPNCPGGYQRPTPDADLPVRGFAEAATDYSIKVFVLAGSDEWLLEGHAFRVQPYELVCNGYHVCSETSTALYVSTQVMNDADQLFAAIEFATGLSALVPPQSEGLRETKLGSTP